MHQLFLYVGSAWAVIALGLLIVAWRAARANNIHLHRKIMIFLTSAAWIFLVLYLVRYRYPEMVTAIPPEYIPWIALHGTVALFPLIGATLMVISRWREQRNPQGDLLLNRNHKWIGRILILLWCFTHLGGIANAVLFS